MTNTKATPRKNKSEEYVFIEKTSSSKDSKNPRFIFAKTEDIKKKINTKYAKDNSFFSRIKFLFMGKKMNADEKQIDKMRTDAANQIKIILERPEFKDVRGADKLLKDINTTKCVRSEELRRVLNDAAFKGILAFPKSDGTPPGASSQESLRTSLHNKYQSLDNLYSIYSEKINNPDATQIRNITHTWGEVKEEKKPNNKSKARTKEVKTPTKTRANNIQSKPQIDFRSEKTIGRTNEKSNTKYNIPGNNLHRTRENLESDKNNALPKTGIAEKNITKNKITPNVGTENSNELIEKNNNTKNISKKNVGEIKPFNAEAKAEAEAEAEEAIQALDTFFLEEFKKEKEINIIEREKKIDALKKMIALNEVKETIKQKLIKVFNPDKPGNRKIYEGLDELIAQVENPERECSFHRDQLIYIFSKKIKTIETEGFPLKLSEYITEIYELYVDKYDAAQKHNSISEIKKVTMPELENLNSYEKQIKLAAELNEQLSEIFAYDKNALGSFIEYCKDPEGSFDFQKRNHYERFLNIFYENINTLPRMIQLKCMSMADSLEGLLEQLRGNGLKSFNYDKVFIDKPEVRKLVNSLQNYNIPASSLLRFLDYLVDGKSSINSKSFWQLKQFTYNQEQKIISFLESDKDIFTLGKVCDELSADLTKYSEENL